MSDYVVAIKPSARRTNGAVGELVNGRGTRRRFDSRADAEAWAAGLSAQGERRVWIRTANPGDRTDADAYLIGRRPPRPLRRLDGAADKRRRRMRGGPSVEQVELGAAGES
ncbi:MAG: hypothetical protein ABEJ22_01295 [Haloferacaceae archaeon]